MRDYKQIWTTEFKNWKTNPGKIESSSGVGSSINRTITVRKIISNIIKKYQIKSIIDCPCGDFHWMKLINLKNIDYLGIDIVDEKIKIDQEKYETENIKFKTMDMLKNKLKKKTDLLICRDMLPHFPFSDVVLFLNNILYSNSKYILMTTFPNHTESEKINSCSWGALNVEKPPYNFSSCKLECYNENDPELKETKNYDKSLILLDCAKLKNIVKKL